MYLIYITPLLLLILIIFFYQKNIANNNKKRFLYEKKVQYQIFEKKLEDKLKQHIERYPKCNVSFLESCLFLKNRFKGLNNSPPPKSCTVPFPIITHALIQPKVKCENYELILAITGSPTEFYQRYVYRKIYRKFKNVKVFFFCGSSANSTINTMVDAESAFHEDTIRLDVLSTYHNTTVQFIGAIRWVNQYCKNYKYVVYHQTDIFINLPYYFRKYSNDKTHTCLCYLTIGAHAFRNKASKWYISEEAYPFEIFPPYPQGPCIFFSENTTKAIVKSSNYMNYTLVIDDVYAGLLLNYANLSKSLTQVAYNVLIYPKIPNNFSKVFWIHSIKPDLIYYYSTLVY